jgi:mannose/fructose/N-acetylgalactosamine-specific phosphotransferase system component IIC
MRPSVRRIERLNYVLGGLLVIAGALTQPKSIALGVAIGVALTCANFFVLSRLVTRWTAEVARAAEGGKTSGNSAYLMLPKMIALMGAVAVAILLLPIDPIAFTVGYSTFIVSIVIDCIYSAAFLARTEDGNEHG